MITGTSQADVALLVVPADQGGFEGAFTTGSTSLGMDMAYRAGAPLRNMEFVAHAPLGVVGTNMVIPQSILSDGATLHTPSGTAIDITASTMTSEICSKMNGPILPVHRKALRPAHSSLMRVRISSQRWPNNIFEDERLHSPNAAIQKALSDFCKDS